MLTLDLMEVSTPQRCRYSKKGNIYTFTNELFNYTLEVQCDNVVIDGAGFALQGIGHYVGITLSYRRNVTIKNMSINQFLHCINITRSSNIVIMENRLSNQTGILLDWSNYCQILRNSMSNDISGLISFSNIAGNDFTGAAYIRVEGDNNAISENCFKGCGTSIQFSGTHGAKYNTISNNTIEAGGGDGINLSPAAIFNTICGNNITEKACGIKIRCAHDNTVHDNYFANNEYGIYVENPKRFENIHPAHSKNNSFYRNNLTGIHEEQTALCTFKIVHASKFLYIRGLQTVPRIRAKQKVYMPTPQNNPLRVLP